MLRLEFWLPLPLIGLAFWVVSGLVTEHNLNQGDRNIESLIITPDNTRSDNDILFIKVTVNRDRQISKVKVKQATQVYRDRSFDLATTELKEVEAAVSRKLNLSPKQVKQLLRYQIAK